MKKILLHLIVGISLFNTSILNAQGSWTQMATYPGANRDQDVSFTIGHYGFIGGGWNGSTYYKDFYKWNQVSNSWSAIATYPGAGSVAQIAFSVNGKGYVGFGESGSGVSNDLWRYDSGANTWTAMATFPGTSRYASSVFVVGHKAYLIAGSPGGPPYFNDVWVYDVNGNTWKQLNNCPAGNIEGPITFTIGNHGYMCGGYSNPNFLTGCWEYDTTHDSWTAIASLPAPVAGSAFVIGSKAYIGEGENTSGTMKDGYVYDTVTKGWTTYTNFGANGIERRWSVAFTIGNYGYIGTGYDSVGTFLNNYWQYYPDTSTKIVPPTCNTWSNETNFPGVIRDQDVGFSIGHYGFIGGGWNGSTYYKDFYKWNQVTNSWSAIATYPGAGSLASIAFSINGYGYVGLGQGSSGVSNDLWRYDSGANTWTAMATFPGTKRDASSVFVVGHKAYLITGAPGGTPYLSDVWVYDANANTWKQLNNCPAGAVEGMITFAIGNHGYIGGGYSNPSFLTGCWEYDTTNDSWTTIASLPIPISGSAFVIGSKAYIDEGENTNGTLKDGYVYDTVTKGWTTYTNFGANGIERRWSVAFTIGNYGYMGTGYDSVGTYHNDYWQYYSCNEVCNMHASFTYTKGASGQVSFTSTSKDTSHSTTYYWDAGDGTGNGNKNTFNYTYASNGTYAVNLRISDSTGGCIADTSINVTITNSAPPTCNTWAKEANFPGVIRDQDVSFTIGHYGFIGGGWNGSTYYKDFYKWNQVSNSWSAIATYPGAGSVAQIAFSVNGKGYVGFGESGSGVSNDLWRYDSGANTWTAMATFPGTSRYASSVFVVGHKAYLIAGSPGGPPYFNDVWVYDVNGNTWKQLNNCPAGNIEGPITFTIGNHGYMCGGYSNPNFLTGCWEYDTTHDSWTAIASLPAPVAGSAFVIGSKAYIGEGENTSGTMKDGYVYDTVTKGWTTYTNFGANGIERRWSVAFTIGNYGYIGTGYDSVGTFLNNYWQYYPCNVVCNMHASFTYTLGAAGQVSFTSTSKDTSHSTTYYWDAGDGTGNGNKNTFNYTYPNNGTYVVSLHISDSTGTCAVDTTISINITNSGIQSCNTWAKETDFTGNARSIATAFSIGHFGFMGNGYDGSTYYKDFYKWNQITNSWSPITSYPGAGSYSSISFSIDGYGYVGMGLGSAGVTGDLWRYDTGKNTWTAMASFPGAARYDANVFVLGHKAYVLAGSVGGPPYLSDVWMYDAHQNTWKQLNSCPVSNVEGMASFAIGNHGYIGGGWSNPNLLTAFWQYDSTNDSWTSIASIPLSGGLGGVPMPFVIGSRAYICIGGTSTNTTALPVGYVYDTITKAWSEFTNMGVNKIERYYSVAFAVGNYGYIGTGKDSLGNNLKDFWQYYSCPDTVTIIPQCPTMYSSFTYTLGAGGQVSFTSTSKDTGKTTTYYWDAGDKKGNGNNKTFSYTYSYNGTYVVNLRLGDTRGSCTADTTISITVTNAVTCGLHANFNYSFGASGLVNFANTSKGITKGTQYYWNAGNGAGYSNNNSFSYTYAYNGTYPVNLYVADSLGSCSSDTTIYVSVTNAGICNLLANFTYTTGSNGQVTFSSTSTGMNATTQLYWYAGDSIGYGYGNPYSYTYAKNGTYPVNLFLYNSNGGCSSDTTINITITNANNSTNTCTLGMYLTSTRASCDTCNNGNATIVATSGSSPYSYHWSNGATTTSIAEKPGIYTCCVTDSKGCSACASVTISDSCLYANFTYSITYDTTGGADSATINFTSISDTVCADSVKYLGPQKLQRVSYTWNFGDGNSQTISGIGVKTCKHTFKPGNYDITLAINHEGSPTKSVTTNPIHVVNSKGIPTGLITLKNDRDLKLFPNPNNGSFKLTINGIVGNQDAQVEVTNLLGEVVYTNSVHASNGMLQQDVNLMVESGTYFIRVTTSSKVYNSKVVISR